MENNTVIQAKDVYKSYSIDQKKETTVLKGLSLEFKKNELICLMGPSGVGKSTLLHILGSLDQPDSGTITLEYKDKIYDYSKMRTEEFASFRNKAIGFVFQFHHLLPEFTALENVMMPALISDTAFSEAKEKALSLLNEVNMIGRESHKPSEISGGEQQRIAIARALINMPEFIFADEPTGNLDSDSASSVLDLLQNIRKKYDITIVIATHSKEISMIADRNLEMRDGKIVG